MFRQKTADPLNDARATVERLKQEVAEAEREAGAAKASYNDALQRYVADGLNGDEPSLQKTNDAAARADRLRQMVTVAAEHLSRLIRAADAAARDTAIRASGSQVAKLVKTVESKLIDFETAIATVREIEAELFDILYNAHTGLKQHFLDPQAQKDANWSHHRLRQRAMSIGEAAHVLVDSRFDTDCGDHFGPLETRLYEAAFRG